MKPLFVACMLCTLAPLAASAQASTDAAVEQAGPTRPPIVAVIDIQRLTAESTMGQQLAADIQAVQQEIANQRTQKQAELNVQRQEVDSLQTELNSSIATLTVDEAEARLQVIRSKERDIQAFFEDGQRQLERFEQQAQQRAAQLQADFQQAVAPMIQEVAESLGVDILLDGQATVFVTADFDISEALIARMNQATSGSGS